MTSQPDKPAGLSLIVFTILILFTMVLHPVGGNVQHLQKIIPMALLSHGLAILSLPFAGLGFYGIMKRLGTANFLSTLGFSMSLMALVAALMAAMTNGVVLPLFVGGFKDASPAAIDALDPTLRYGHAVNAAFDYLYTCAFILAILCWSIAILKTRRLSLRLGYWGIVVAIVAAILAVLGPSPAGLHGLYLFVAALISWMILVGRELMG